MYPYVHIGAFTLLSYHLMVGVGTVATVLYAWWVRKSYGMSGIKSIVFGLTTAFTSYCAGKLLYAILNPSQVLEGGPLSGGMTIFGPIFLCIFLGPLVGWFFGLKPKPVLDLSAPRQALLIGFIRIGCFLNGCCGGWEACAFGTCFRWPTQMIESFGDFLIFAILAEKRQEWKYRLYPMFLILYGTLRFFVEFLRETDKNILFLSHWQWFSIVAVLIGVLWNHSAKEKSNG